MSPTRRRPLHVLLVDDDEGDVLMTREALSEAKRRSVLHVVTDGEAGLAFLRRHDPYEKAPVPDLVLLDLNLPRVGGREVLSRVKADPVLRRIPVVVFTTSRSEADLTASYDAYANAFVTKPSGYAEFAEVVRQIDHFFDEVASRPHP